MFILTMEDSNSLYIFDLEVRPRCLRGDAASLGFIFKSEEDGWLLLLLTCMVSPLCRAFCLLFELNCDCDCDWERLLVGTLLLLRMFMLVLLLMSLEE